MAADSWPVFALAETSPAGPTSETVGPWALLPGTASFAFGAGLGADATVAASVWRVDLPLAPRRALDFLAGAEARLAMTERGLTEARVRLDALVGSRQSASFSASAGAAAARPEATLLLTLDQLRYGGQSAHYGLGDDVRDGWERMAGRFQDEMARLRQVVGGAAWVETRIEGRLMARTRVGWTNDAETVFDATLDPVTTELHHRAVALALGSRAATLRMLALAARGVATLSTFLVPGGALLALPAAWRFIADVTAEVDASRERARDRAT